MTLFTKGSFGVLFNRESTLDLSGRYLVFDLSKLDHYPKIRTIYYSLISIKLYSRLSDPRKQQFIFLDEVWKLLADTQSLMIIENLVRTARKYGGYITLISQGLSDFVGNSQLDSIRNNTNIHYFFNINTDTELLSSAYSLNENQIEKIKNLNSIKGKYSELFCRFYKESFCIKVEPTEIEIELCSTDFESIKKYEDKTNDEIKELLYA